MRLRSLLFATALGTTTVATAFAQPDPGSTAAAETAIHGTVTDSVTGKGIGGVTVYRQETDETAVTDDGGHFTFAPGGTPTSHLTIVDPSYARTDLVVADTRASHAIDIKLTPV